MSLTNCKECGKEISSNAISCPGCGNLIKPLVIEQTKKKWKVVQLISVLLIIVSVFMFVVNLPNESSNAKYWWLLLVIVSFITLGIGKFGAWWNNR